MGIKMFLLLLVFCASNAKILPVKEMSFVLEKLWDFYYCKTTVAYFRMDLDDLPLKTSVPICTLDATNKAFEQMTNTHISRVRIWELVCEKGNKCQKHSAVAGEDKHLLIVPGGQYLIEIVEIEEIQQIDPPPEIDSEEPPLEIEPYQETDQKPDQKPKLEVLKPTPQSIMTKIDVCPSSLNLQSSKKSDKIDSSLIEYAKAVQEMICSFDFVRPAFKDISPCINQDANDCLQIFFYFPDSLTNGQPHQELSFSGESIATLKIHSIRNFWSPPVFTFEFQVLFNWRGSEKIIDKWNISGEYLSVAQLDSHDDFLLSMTSEHRAQDISRRGISEGLMKHLFESFIGESVLFHQFFMKQSGVTPKTTSAVPAKTTPEEKYEGYLKIKLDGALYEVVSGIDMIKIAEEKYKENFTKVEFEVDDAFSWRAVLTDGSVVDIGFEKYYENRNRLLGLRLHCIDEKNAFSWKILRMEDEQKSGSFQTYLPTNSARQ